MGNTSSTTYRRVQPSLVHTFKYNRLLSSSRSDSQEPLLVDNHHQVIMRVQPSLVHTFKYNRLLSSSRSDSQKPLLVDNHHQNVEQLKLENETNQRKKESLEKQNAILEKDMRDFKEAITSKKVLDSSMENKVAALEKQVAELKTTISMLKSVSSEPVTPDVEQLKRETETNLAKDTTCDFEATVRSMRKPDSDRGNKVAALEKQVADLKSDHSRLKSTSSQTVTPGLSGSGSETTHLKKKVERLKLQLMKLELDNSTRKLEKETAAQKIAKLEKQLLEHKEIAAQKIAELEKQLLELTPTHKTKLTSSVGLSGSGSDTTHLKKKVERLKLQLMKLELDNSTRKLDKETAAQKIAELEKQLLELTPTHKTQPTSSVGLSGSGLETTHLKKKVERLKLQLMKLELDNSTRKLDKETAAQKIAELEKQLLELTPTHKTKPASSVEIGSLGTLAGQEFGNPVHDLTNDLVGYLVVLIFLVVVLVGLNLY